MGSGKNVLDLIRFIPPFFSPCDVRRRYAPIRIKTRGLVFQVIDVPFASFRFRAAGFLSKYNGFPYF